MQHLHLEENGFYFYVLGPFVFVHLDHYSTVYSARQAADTAGELFARPVRLVDFNLEHRRAVSEATMN